jgi:hypothetical protein
MTITTTSHRSREMTVSLGPLGTLAMGTKIEHLQQLNIRDTRCVPASPLSQRNETHLFHVCLNTTSICNGHQTTIVTTTSHRSREMTVSLSP